MPEEPHPEPPSEDLGEGDEVPLRMPELPEDIFLNRINSMEERLQALFAPAVAQTTAMF